MSLPRRHRTTRGLRLASLRGLFGGGQPAPETIRLRVAAEGPLGEIEVPNRGDGEWELVEQHGRHCLAPAATSHYLYFVIPADLRQRLDGNAAAFLEVEYVGDSYGRFRIQYASRDAGAPEAGLYKAAEQLWSGDSPGSERLRRALFPLPGFDATRTQNHGASFRVEFREDVRIAGLQLRTDSPADVADAFPARAPLPELKKLPGRFYPINYLFIEITNACNFKCTWCPDAIMERRRAFMPKHHVFALLEQIAEKRSWLGPLYPVKLHQMGEPFLHPDLVAIVEHAERLGLGVELNTNCGLITQERIDALLKAGLTNLILSYQTPDAESFKTRKAPRLSFDEYRDKVRLAVERKIALRARTHIEIDIMNTKHHAGASIVSEDEQALAFLEDWIGFAQGLERRYRLEGRRHDWAAIRSRRFLDADENGSRYGLLDDVDLIWKRCHSWGNVIGAGEPAPDPDTYCPAPYEQFVIQANGDVVSCCTDYEGRTKIANVFAESIESIWTGRLLTQRKRDMLEGRLLDVCAKCQGHKRS
jgi:radical SAM protein with 4Fe4S-binding SPASM domain